MNQPPTDKLAEAMLLILRNPMGRIVPVSEIATDLTSTNSEVRIGLSRLEEWGYSLAVTATDACLTATPDSLTETEIGYGLSTQFIGNRILAYRRVGSTNDLAAEQANTKFSHGTVIIAEEQTKGRGRLGRAWHSAPATGAFLSILLRPTFAPREAPGISLLTGLALVECLQSYCPGEAQIKWPNDVFIKGKKVAGILTELFADADHIHHLVVGVGININQSGSDFPDEIGRLATSVSIACGREVNRCELVRRFLRSFESEYVSFCKDGLAGCLGRLRQYSYLNGRRVKLSSGHRTIEGEVIGIGPQGALLVETGGETMAVTCGEVTVVEF